MGKDASGKLTHSQFSHIRFWFDKTHQNVWQNILFDLFESATEQKDENEESDNNNNLQLIDYDQLLFHLCFNDQSHCGVEKMITLSRNLNMIQDKEIITNDDLELMQLRGIKNVELDHSIIRNIYPDELTMVETKQDDKINASFNLVNIA